MRSVREFYDENIEIISPLSDCYMADEWYQFAETSHFWIKWRFEALRNILQKNYIWDRTLDIGCGNGVVREQIESHYNCKVEGCDLNLGALRMASLKRGSLYFYNIHERLERFKEAFKTIILLDVLEHVKAPILFLDSVKFHLQNGGIVIINVPAFQFLYSKYDEIQGHQKRYTMKSLKNELRLSGFYIERVTYWGISLIPLLLIRKFFVRFCPKEKIMETGFQPKSSIIDFSLQLLRRFECVIFPQPPVGTSLMVVARKVN